MEKITSSNNHVCRLEPSAGQGVVVKEIGWRKASTFPGYCAEHDSRIFGVLEHTPFTGTHEQCVLQAYRSVCNELYKKRALIESLQFQRDVIDRGCEVDEQINRQLSVATNIAGQTKSLQELEELWLKFEGAVTRGAYDRFSSRCYFLTGDLSVASSAALHAEFDFHGNVLADMWDLEIDAEMLSHSIMATDKGGAVVFVWLAGEKSPELVVSSFDKVASDEKGDVFVQYCFLNSENTYFSQEWWNGLDELRQSQLRKYSEALFYEGGTFVANQNRLVNWSFGD